MALTVNHPTLKEAFLTGFTVSCASTPIVANIRAPFRGRLGKCTLVVSAAFTTDMSVAVAINGTAVGGSPFTVTASGSGAGTIGTLAPTSAYNVTDDDIVSFTPSGSTGSAVAAQVTANFIAG